MALCKSQKTEKVSQIKKILADVPEDEIQEVIKLALRETPTPEEVKEIQLARLVRFGYPKAAGLTEEGFASLVPMPEDKLGALLVVKPEVVSIYKQMELIGGKCYLNITELKDIAETPNLPIYWRYDVENGKKMLNRTPDDCMKEFKKEKRFGAVVVEGIALVAQNPDILKDHYIDLPGSRFGAGSVLYFGLYDDRPGLSDCDSDFANSHYGSASCGSP